MLQRALDQGYADPRRLHAPARNARLLLDNAREATAAALGVRADEVSFTSSGTEAVHRGLLGLLRGRRDVGLVHSAVEHSAVLHAARWSGVPTRSAAVDASGRTDEAVVLDAAADLSVPLGVAAVQAANHEVGTIQPVAEIAAALGAVPLFVDACALAGRLPLPGGWAAAAASAHKWGGPAGVGVLLVRRGVRWATPFPDDDRVDHRTAGFENVPSVLAAAAALQAVVTERDETNARHHELVARVRDTVASLADTEVVGDPDRRLPHLVTFSCLYLNGEALVTELDRRGFAIASGSACTASSLTPSHVLEAMGVLTHGNVRLSLSRDTSAAEVERFLGVLPGVVAELRARVGL